MKDELTFKDFYRFLIDNIKIIVTTVIVSLILVIVFVVLSNLYSDSSETVDTNPIESPRQISEERYEEYAELPVELFTEPQISQMQAYLLPKAYKITLYAEHENHEPIENTTFMRAVFRNNEVLNYIEESLDSVLTPDIDFAVHIENLSNSGVYELHFQRGTKEESLELAYIVINAIDEGLIPILDNKNVYFVEDEPELVQGDYSNYGEEEINSSDISIRNMVRDLGVYGVIGAGAGVIVGIIIALLGIIFNENVTALYDYAQKDSDKVVRLNHLKNVNSKEYIEKGLANINISKSKSVVLLFDEKTKDEWTNLFVNLNPNVKRFKDFSDFNDNLEEMYEVVILTKVNKTSKVWYNNQRVQLNGYNIPVKIIQF